MLMDTNGHTILREDYVSFETAKLLKEKGFDVYTPTRYDYDGGFHSHGNHLIGDSDISAPTHQMAMKWLREKYYIHADPIKQGNYNDCSEYYSWIVSQMGIIHRNPSVADKLSYEEAVEAACIYALKNLI